MLQAFVPLPHFIANFGKNRPIPPNWDVTPAIHNEIESFAQTLTDIVAKQPSKQVHADVFGIELLHQLVREGIAENFAQEALSNHILNVELSSGRTHQVPFTIQDAKNSVTRSKIERNIAHIDRDPEQTKENTAVDIIVSDLIDNTARYSSGTQAGARFRYSYDGFNVLFGSKFLELSVATPVTTFADAVLAGKSDDDTLFREAFRKLNKVNQSREALFFAILPGFSSRDTGIRKPTSLGSNGMALFYQAQLSRVAGAFAIQSDRHVMFLGKYRPSRVGPWRWQKKLLPLDLAITGTVVGSHLRYDRLKLEAATLQISLVCAEKFWEEQIPLRNRLKDPSFFDKSSLEAVYDSYLAFEAEYLAGTENFENLIIPKFATKAEFDEATYKHVRARLLNAGPANIPLDDNIKSLAL